MKHDLSHENSNNEGFRDKRRKYFVGQKMDVTPEKRDEIGDYADDFTGNEFASRKKQKIKLSQLKK